MSETWRQITNLIARGEAQISAHGYDELAEDNIFAQDAVTGIVNAVVVEDYPAFHKGPAVLVLQQDRNGHPVHVVEFRRVNHPRPFWLLHTDQTQNAGQVISQGEKDDQQTSDKTRTRRQVRCRS